MRAEYLIFIGGVALVMVVLVLAYITSTPIQMPYDDSDDDESG